MYSKNEDRLRNIGECFGKEIQRAFFFFQDEVYEHFYTVENQMTISFIATINEIIKEFMLDKDKIKFIDISFLFSSFSMKEYQFKITGYNKDYYMDTKEYASFFDYGLAMNRSETYFDNLIEKVRSSGIRVNEYEIHELHIHFAIIYFAFMQNILIDILNSTKVNNFLIENADIFDLKLYFKYGGYLDNNSSILQELTF